MRWHGLSLGAELPRHHQLPPSTPTKLKLHHNSSNLRHNSSNIRQRIRTSYRS